MNASVDTVLAWLDGEPAHGDDQMRSFEQALVLIVAVEYVCRALRAAAPPPGIWAATGLIAVAATVVLLSPWRRTGLVTLASVHAAVMAYEFPASGNHAYLELVFLGLLSFLDSTDVEQRRLFLRSGRWIVCVILFASGVQKLFHGYYDRGQFLAYKMRTETYRTILQPLVDATEAARLAAMNGQPGSGPYLPQSPLLIGASRAVVLAEMTLPPFLVARSTRRLAVVATLALLVAIEAGAREVFFGLVMVDAVLLFGSATTQRAFVPVVTVLLTGLLLVRVGLLPPVVFN